MNYVFLDTCSWIDFASGKNDQSKHDFTENNWKILESLFELKSSNDIVFLKNEIVDLEFKNAPINQFVEAYKSQILGNVRSNLESKVIVHCNNRLIRELLRETLIKFDQLFIPFQEKSVEFSKNVWSLYNEAVHINVSESLKQKALGYAINRNHLLFGNNKNNINDFLILYSIQEWIYSYEELKSLDETSQEHVIYFVTKNVKDFGIDKNGKFGEDLDISQLIKPVRNLSELISKVKAKKYESQDFLPTYFFDKTPENTPQSPTEKIIDSLYKLIDLKREFFLSYIKKAIDQNEFNSKLKYIGNVILPKHENSRLNLPLIRSQNIINGRLHVDNFISSNIHELSTLSRQGDVLIPAIGAKAGEHCINRLPFETAVHPSIYVLRIDQSKVNIDYLDYVLSCTPVKAYPNQIGMQRLTAAELVNSYIKLPSMKRQCSLVSLFKEKEKEIEQDILKIKSKIKMLLI